MLLPGCHVGRSTSCTRHTRLTRRHPGLTGKIASGGFDEFKELERNQAECRRPVMADYLAAQVKMFLLF